MVYFMVQNWIWMIWGYPLWLRKPRTSRPRPHPRDPTAGRKSLAAKPQMMVAISSKDAILSSANWQIDHTTHSQPTGVDYWGMEYQETHDHIQSMVIPLWWKSHLVIGHPLWMEGWMQIYIYIYKLGSCQLAMFDYQRPEKKWTTV